MYSRLLVPLDGFELAEQSLPYAHYLGEALQSQIELLHIVESTPPNLSAELSPALHVRNSSNDKGECYLESVAAKESRLIVTPERDTGTGLIGKITIEIQLPPDFPEHYIEAVKRAAELCAVKKHLYNPPAFEILTTSASLAAIDA